jgi:hypothetical protein
VPKAWKPHFISQIEVSRINLSMAQYSKYALFWGTPTLNTPPPIFLLSMGSFYLYYLDFYGKRPRQLIGKKMCRKMEKKVPKSLLIPPSNKEKCFMPIITNG